MFRFFFLFSRWLRNVTSRWRRCPILRRGFCLSSSQLRLSRASDRKSKSRYFEAEYGVAPRFAECNEQPASGDLRQIPPRGDSRAVSEEIPALQKWSARARLTTRPHRQLAYILADILPPLPRERSNNALARVHMYTRVHVTARMYTRCRVHVRVAGADIFHFRHRSQTTWVSI